MWLWPNLVFFRERELALESGGMEWGWAGALELELESRVKHLILFFSFL